MIILLELIALGVQISLWGTDLPVRVYIIWMLLWAALTIHSFRGARR